MAHDTFGVEALEDNKTTAVGRKSPGRLATTTAVLAATYRMGSALPKQRGKHVLSSEHRPQRLTNEVTDGNDQEMHVV